MVLLFGIKECVQEMKTRQTYISIEVLIFKNLKSFLNAVYSKHTHKQTHTQTQKHKASWRGTYINTQTQKHTQTYTQRHRDFPSVA